LRIGAFSRRLGVSVSVLRAWEQRYGLFTPTRTPGGFRLYSASDEHRARRMLTHLSEGLAARESASLALAPEADAGSLIEAWAAFDATRAHAVLDELLARPEPAGVVNDEVLPALARAAQTWAGDEHGAARVHFAARLLETRLLALGDRWHEGSGPLALLGCGPGDQHTMGALTLALALHARGWRIAYLGASTAAATFVAAAAALRPQRVIVAFTVREARAGTLRDLREVPNLVVAGPGVTRGRAAAARLERLDGSPVMAAAALQV
jgi:DNA-binding transcriptional MerR regulator